MSVRPYLDRILARRLDPEDRTPGGIIIPETVRERSEFAQIVSIGDRCLTTEIVEGDKVLIGHYAGTEILIEGEDLLLIKNDDIMAKCGDTNQIFH